ncbi:hypothetical protein G6F56_001562 [Rhizopus delemar]|uniref:C2H2-type domain-containing protein n=1 Tax=Rhizopus stolonifer TaxID=4846 RepID=A0A367KXN3_RHIST|nr:hypothetical protein G6F56_001562 [Rhizopus delemar]RCI06961.1 hypothetical protein CU098_013470 [Rhizopus stolonifer]
MCNSDLVLSIKNASGRHVNLLNESTIAPSLSAFRINPLESSLNSSITSKRKYHCDEPGCNKSFTTSGHLARHNRIHTGEKNFHCLHPGCPSRFSRQDNMMQHYRTHLSQKERRQQQQLKKVVQKAPFPTYCHSQEEQKLSKPATRPRRSITMPSLPYPIFDVSQHERPSVRPRRALSTSSTCSSASSLTPSPYASPQFNYILPPPTIHLHPSASHPQHLNYPHLHHHQHVDSKNLTSLQPPQWKTKPSEKSLSSLINLANIVSTFG